MIKVVTFMLCILPQFKKYRELIKTGLAQPDQHSILSKKNSKFSFKHSAAFLLFEKWSQTLFVEKDSCAIGNRQIHYSDQFHTNEEPNILAAANVLLEK